MKVQITLTIPDDFYFEHLTDADVAEALKLRLQSAADHEWPYARMGTVEVTTVTVTTRKEG